ncbi:host cell division inhibitor Icd-like protein [Vibrio aestuarianus]|uniref:host cell division inhibitor Icd-like protein n=1 Tax=Vibrio aestuarianus TaxID=28171 RepID=UPI00237C7AF9|nr:host cell division inhibitor Icd-like protein [Vibrio aestuarianus]MDE1333333.1 host cell division inhibitor Icd-like protein [Vibrio aestuarianus]
MHTFKFAALRRSTPNSIVQQITCSANSEREARKLFARDYVLVFAAVIRNGGVA